MILFLPFQYGCNETVNRFFPRVLGIWWKLGPRVAVSFQFYVIVFWDFIPTVISTHSHLKLPLSPKGLKVLIIPL